MRTGIDLTGQMELLNIEGFIVLNVDETGYVIDVVFDTGLNLTIREPRAFNESGYWRAQIKHALEMREAGLVGKGKVDPMDFAKDEGA